MDYFVYCRDRPGVMELRWELAEAHWSFMDRYAETMIARGPTLTPDGEAATGSAHIVGLPDAAAARTFAFEEPNYRAGVYDDVLIRRFTNTLGRTMWEFPGGREGLLIIAHDPATAAMPGELVAAEDRDRLIACGPLLSDDGTQWLGTAIMAELPDRSAAEAMMARAPVRYATVEVHPWRFGGRPAA
ncbi:YciI family protein [Paractinoplanes durhamensis]|uniref:YCII-related domain-containing protein n=1 Tax=Paractinoplanes durhamensis TaxID=113563 RepID=A0ABQ3Z958_9ACTN|nr:YciI family protein [Actinoplanes durhamensis]GIE06368.1 hypothetical protein Adu01nite_77180 [Actinoplanes durhamensis]